MCMYQKQTEQQEKTDRDGQLDPFYLPPAPAGPYPSLTRRPADSISDGAFGGIVGPKPSVPVESPAPSGATSRPVACPIDVDQTGVPILACAAALVLITCEYAQEVRQTRPEAAKATPGDSDVSG
ncbi:hypothetical protein VTJ04DRAFT_21 [Mycothermus thermophilus]|uniref:uncharacterized protein n=1 Tax=Humicola insolens TaxID=85995 RepID=UPI003741ED7A